MWLEFAYALIPSNPESRPARNPFSARPLSRAHPSRSDPYPRTTGTPPPMSKRWRGIFHLGDSRFC